MKKFILTLLAFFFFVGIVYSDVTVVVGGDGAAAGCTSTPNLGYSSIGGSGQTITNGDERLSLFTASASGTLADGYIYHNSTGSDNAILLLYSDDGDDTPNSGDSLIAYSNSVVSSAVEWAQVSWAFGSGASITNGNTYWLIIAAGAGDWACVYQNSGTNYEPSADQGFYSSPPATLEASGFTWNVSARQNSAYVTICVP